MVPLSPTVRLRHLMFTLTMPLGLAAVVFVSAGRWNLPFVWSYVGVVVLLVPVGYRLADPGLIAERLHPGSGGQDRKLRMIASPFFLVHLIVAGLDLRFGWSGQLSPWIQTAGLIGFVLFLALPMWAMAVNPFFSPVVRIQSERGHKLITSGPYRWIRHPGYLAALIAFPCGGIALGSWWSLLPYAPLCLLILRRTIIEDRFLHEHLPGYADYARRVRYRLIPYVW